MTSLYTNITVEGFYIKKSSLISNLYENNTIDIIVDFSIRQYLFYDLHYENVIDVDWIYGRSPLMILYTKRTELMFPNRKKIIPAEFSVRKGHRWWLFYTKRSSSIIVTYERVIVDVSSIRMVTDYEYSIEQNHLW